MSGAFEQYFGVLLDGALQFDSEESLWAWLDERNSITPEDKEKLYKQWLLMKNAGVGNGEVPRANN